MKPYLRRFLAEVAADLRADRADQLAAEYGPGYETVTVSAFGGSTGRGVGRLSAAPVHTPTRRATSPARPRSYSHAAGGVAPVSLPARGIFGQVAGFSTRLKVDRTAKRLVGLALPWNTLSTERTRRDGEHRWMFRPGSFTDWLASAARSLPDVRAGRPIIQLLKDHDPKRSFGNTTDGFFTLSEAALGLWLSVDLRHPLGARVGDWLARHPDQAKLSIHFEADEYRTIPVRPFPGRELREVTRAKVHEVSFLSDPAFPQTFAVLTPIIDRSR